MPLIDDATIESLREPQGFSRFSLYLIGAVPLSHRAYNPPQPLPAESQWRPRVLCSKVSRSRMRAIVNHARKLHQSDKKHRWEKQSRVKTKSSPLRRLRRKLQTKFNAILKLLDKELQNAH